MYVCMYVCMYQARFASRFARIESHQGRYKVGSVFFLLWGARVGANAPVSSFIFSSSSSSGINVSNDRDNIDINAS